MFYEPTHGHGLPHDPIKAIVAPRPIGWISTVDAEGRPNLAPYSYFNAISTDPPMVCFSSGGMKHSAVNARATGEFVYNLATQPLAREMNASSEAVPPEVDEFELTGLATAASRLVRPPRVAASPAAFECRVVTFMELTDIEGRGVDSYLVVGQVIGVHIDEAYLKAGRFDTAAAVPLGRCGYHDYTAVDEIFEMRRPDGGG